MRSSTLILLLLLPFAFSFQGCFFPKEEEEVTTDTGGPICTEDSYGITSTCYYSSDWKSVNEMSGMSYRLKCTYKHGSLYIGYDVYFEVEVKNKTGDQYLHTKTYFGIPAYTSSVSDAVGPNDVENVAKYGHSSLDDPQKQCREAYTGKIEFSYADKYGNKTGSTVATKEFDSTTLPLNF